MVNDHHIERKCTAGRASFLQYGCERFVSLSRATYPFTSYQLDVHMRFPSRTGKNLSFSLFSSVNFLPFFWGYRQTSSSYFAAFFGEGKADTSNQKNSPIRKMCGTRPLFNPPACRHHLRSR